VLDAAGQKRLRALVLAACRGPLRESLAGEKSAAGIAEFSLFLPQAAFDLRDIGNEAAAWSECIGGACRPLPRYTSVLLGGGGSRANEQGYDQKKSAESLNHFGSLVGCFACHFIPDLKSWTRSRFNQRHVPKG
jgi:hypothetical protein